MNDHGVTPCNTLTGEVGPVIIAGTGYVTGLALGIAFLFLQTKPKLIYALTAAPAYHVWTASTHVSFSPPAQRIAHLAVGVLCKTGLKTPPMHLPYELVELILSFAREPRKRIHRD